MARRFAGEVREAEMGFRFGEPLDADGDAVADVAAGTRFKLRSGLYQNGSATVWSGANGALIHTWEGAFNDGLFGQSALLVPDLDGDALADVVVSAPHARARPNLGGVLSARSPRSGEEIWRREADREESFGWDLAAAGDRDGDGRMDVFVGAPATSAGRAYLVSGRDGAIVRTFAPPEDTPSFGWYVARVDDLDDDGSDDLAVGAYVATDAQGAATGAVYLFSSATGAQLRRRFGTDHYSGFGEVVASIGDLEGDGVGDVVVSAPRTNDRTRARAGDVYVYSGKTGEELRHWSGSQPGELYGRMVVSAGDVDGDGAEDLAVSAPWHRRDGDERVGRVELRSGRSGELLAELFGDGADCWFGWHVRRTPDPEARGRPALLIGSLRHPVGDRSGVGVIDLYVLQRAAVATK